MFFTVGSVRDEEMKKSSITSAVARFVFVRLFICALTVGLFAYVLEHTGLPASAKMAAFLVFTAAMCFYTSVTVFRRINLVIEQSAIKLEETSATLMKTAASLRGVADAVKKNAVLLDEFVCLVDKQKTGSQAADSEESSKEGQGPAL